MTYFSSSLLQRSVTIVSLILCVGCWGDTRPPTYRVTGTVTWKGKPVDKATLIFVPKGKGEPASAITDEAGKYELTTYKSGDGARPGEYRVKVSKYNMDFSEPSEDARFLSYEEEQQIYNDPSLRPTPPPKNLLPKKYENENTSGIEHSVGEKPSTKDITIE